MVMNQDVMKTNLPKTLTISIEPWNDLGCYQSCSSFFKTEWDPKRLALVYVRGGASNTSICGRVFKISENEVVGSVFKRDRAVGSEVPPKSTINAIQTDEAPRQKEYNYYAWKGTFLRPVLNICRELAWLFGNWKTRELEKFVKDFDPDVLFIPVFPAIYILRVANHLVKIAKKPVAAYFLDDSFTYKSVRKNPVSLVQRWILRKYVRSIIKQSAQVAVISPKQKEVYDKLLGIDSVVLTQSVDYSRLSYKAKESSLPFRMVYTGSLAYGRWKTLALMAQALKKINKRQTQITLDIYTQSILNDRQQRALNQNGCRVVGKIGRDEVSEVQQNADILLFVESLDRKRRNCAYLSFSTKISDYLANGRCIFAVGSKNVAPIEYFRRYDSAITATSFREIVQQLQKIVDDPSLLETYGKKGFLCGFERHSKDVMEPLFRRFMLDAVESKVNEVK